MNCIHITFYFEIIIKIGHNNIITLSAILVASDDSLKSIEPKDRQCMYEEENDFLKIYKNYTQTNCYFECFYFIAQEFVKNKHNSSESCVPWFFPTPKKLPLICNPWEAVDFLEKMLSVSTMNCQHCLSDCYATIYKTRVTSVPLRKCHLVNFGNSHLCDGKQNPLAFYNTLSSDYRHRFQTHPFYMNKYSSSIRRSGRFNLHLQLQLQFFKAG